MKRYLILLLILVGSTVMDAQVVDANSIVGVWKSPDNSYMIKIDKIGDQFQGRIVWLAESEGQQILLDKHNPNDQLRKLPLKGNKIIKDLTFNNQNHIWDGGKFYNYKEGKTYSCQISLQSSDRIQIIRFTENQQAGKTETWVRQ